MRAALLLIPLAALAAAALAAGGQEDDAMDMGNAAEAEAMALEAMMDAAGNTTEAPLRRPAWMAGRTWLWAAEAEDGAVWYFEALDSDFTVRPYRVLLRTEESGDPDSRHDNSERLAEIDCAGRRYRILRTTHYDQAGRATEADERGDGRMVAMVPGSVLEAVGETVCRHAAAPDGVYTNGL